MQTAAFDSTALQANVTDEWELVIAGVQACAGVLLFFVATATMICLCGYWIQKIKNAK